MRLAHARHSSRSRYHPVLMARIVLTSFGSLGDIHPYLALGLGLRDRGHRVALATHGFYRDKVEAEGIDFFPLRPEGDPNDRELAALLMDIKKGPERVLRGIVLPALRETYEDLRAAAEGADLLVGHPLTFAVPLVSGVLGIPWASAALAPLSFFSAFDPPVLAPFPWLAHLRALGPWVNRQVMNFGRRTVLPWTEPVRRLRQELGLPPGENPIFEGQHSPSLVLALFSSLLGARQPDWPPQTVAAGHLFYDRHGAPAALSAEVEAFLAAGEAPLVFTLGSAAVLNPGTFFAESAAAAKSLGRRAILVGAETQEGLPSSILAVPYVAYSQLFPRAAAIVHQGGIGTVGQALAAGRPMLVVPFSHDQPDNAARLVRLGVARTLGRLQDERAVPALAGSALVHSSANLRK
ncbi:MAG TPA: glycosyltransferase, partial [Acidobacteria bacterium]|nr:glycosyltransferase [Acidobacteriota bacterium]